MSNDKRVQDTSSQEDLGEEYDLKSSSLQQVIPSAAGDGAGNQSLGSQATPSATQNRLAELSTEVSLFESVETVLKKVNVSDKTHVQLILGGTHSHTTTVHGSQFTGAIHGATFHCGAPPAAPKRLPEHLRAPIQEDLSQNTGSNDDDDLLDGRRGTQHRVAASASSQFAEISNKLSKLDDDMVKLQAGNLALTSKVDEKVDKLSKQVDAGNVALISKVDEKVDKLSKQVDAGNVALTSKVDEKVDKLSKQVDAGNVALASKMDEQGDKLSKQVDASNVALTSKVDENTKTLSNQLDGFQGQLTFSLKGIHVQLTTVKDKLDQRSQEIIRKLTANETAVYRTRDDMDLMLNGFRHLMEDALGNVLKSLEVIEKSVLETNRGNEETSVLHLKDIFNDLTGKMKDIQSKLKTVSLNTQVNSEVLNDWLIPVQHVLETMEAVERLEASERQSQQGFQMVKDKMEKVLEKLDNLNMGTNIPDSDVEHVALIRQHYHFLERKMDTVSGLITELYMNNVLNEREKQDLEAIPKISVIERNKKLLFIMSKKSPGEFQKFCAALVATHQKHVADLIAGDVQGCDIWKHEQIIKKLYGILKDNMFTEYILDYLIQDDVIDISTMEQIKRYSLHSERNSALLNVLDRKSYQQFEIFVQALRNTSQEHLAGAITEELAKL